mgnify:CR=1 FL=1
MHQKIGIVHINSLKDKIRLEIKQGLEKERILNDEDAALIYKFYHKIKKRRLIKED